MNNKFLFFLLFVGLHCLQYTFVAQNNTIHNLDSIVVIADKRFQKNSISYKVIELRDSIISNNLESFSSLLRFNSPIYIRENGPSGIGSVSFRGTGSSNTAVTWNGININFGNNGQTDLNSFSVGLYDNIFVRSGGGSTEFGSGAIGGTIVLENDLLFLENTEINNQFVSSLGSFTSFRNFYKLQYTSPKFSTDFGVSYNSSKNDFPIKDTDFRNTNGSYFNYEIQLSNGYKFSDHFNFKLYNVYSFGDRLFSGELPNPTSANDKYQDILQRHLLKLSYDKSKFQVETKFAYIFQKFTFFDDKDSDPLSYGSSTRYFGDVHLDYNILKNATLSARVKYESIFGETDQIVRRQRTETTQSLIFNHFVNEFFSYNLKVRHDYNSDFEVPLTFASGFKLKPIQHFFVRANVSKNFRAPTLNDLFWPSQGNPNLTPETSVQGELGLGYKNNKFLFDIAYFNINLKDRITWLPGGDALRPGVWVPINISETNNSGLEILSTYTLGVFENKLDVNMNYNYTIAKNKETYKLLPFVPRHVFNSNISYSLSKISFFVQQIYNGSIFTTQSNSPDFTNDAFYLLNFGGNYHIKQKNKNPIRIGLKINNVFDHKYNIVQNRPMPGINYNLNINYKF